MALITDPDDLSQGASKNVTDAAWTASSGTETTITSTANLPSMGTGEYFEVRNHSTPGNNGLYQSSGTPTTSSITADKISGPNPADAGSEAVDVLHDDGATANEKSVHFDVGTSGFYLLEQGNLTVDGATEQAIYSFMKDEWKADTDLIAYQFPMVGITPDSFEFVKDWEPKDVTSPVIRTRKLIRTGGWSEVSSAGILKAQWAGIRTLGDFEDPDNDLAYYAFGTDPTLDNTVDFDFAGPLNEALKTFDELGNPDTCDFATTSTITRATGSFITDGYVVGGQVNVRAATVGSNDGAHVLTGVAALTLTVAGTPFTTGADTAAQLAVDNRNSLNLFLRVRDGDPKGKTFTSSNLAAIGISSLTNKAETFLLSNTADQNISETDANIDANSPYTEIEVRYFDQDFNIDIDTPGSPRAFGIVVDVGTHSGVDGSTSGAGSVLTSAEGAIPTDATYTGGTLIIHDGPDAGTYTITGTPTATTVTITTTFATGGSNQSFSIQRATPVVASKIEIYEKVQRMLRLATDIDSTDQTVIGKTGDELLRFVGSQLEAGQGAPTNPNGGGSGVTVVGFDSNDTNALTFFDNAATSRQFPFVSAATTTFNDNAVNDAGPAEHTHFFRYTTQTAVADLAISSSAGDTASIDSAGANLPTLVQNDYVRLGGSADENNNGIWVVTDASPTASQFDARKWDGKTVSDETAFAGTVDQDPIDSPQAIIVEDNSSVPIQGNVAASVSWDFDYDNNTQGGRTAGTDAAIEIRLAGTNLAQNTSTQGTITRAVGLSFSVVAGLERNYSNP